ncbi:hypothetical protein OIV83_005093 [Microbotryomycetes sp. JL201]|nr:hypothetical protein OIV83_005093 [Microbotryomycetes sp. JL201]
MSSQSTHSRPKALLAREDEVHVSLSETIEAILHDHNKATGFEDDFAKLLHDLQRSMIPTTRFVFSELLGFHTTSELRSIYQVKTTDEPHRLFQVSVGHGDSVNFHGHLTAFVRASIRVLGSYYPSLEVFSMIEEEMNKHVAGASIGRLVLACYTAMDILGWESCGFNFDSIVVTEIALQSLIRVCMVKTSPDVLKQHDKKALLENDLLAREVFKLFFDKHAILKPPGQVLSAFDNDRREAIELYKTLVSQPLLTGLQSHAEHLGHLVDGFVANSSMQIALSSRAHAALHPLSSLWCTYHQDTLNTTKLAHAIISATSEILHDPSNRNKESGHLHPWVYASLSTATTYDELCRWTAAQKDKILILALLYVRTFNHINALKRNVGLPVFWERRAHDGISSFKIAMLGLIEDLKDGFKRIELNDLNAEGDTVFELAQRKDSVTVWQSGEKEEQEEMAFRDGGKMVCASDPVVAMARHYVQKATDAEINNALDTILRGPRSPVFRSSFLTLDCLLHGGNDIIKFQSTFHCDSAGWKPLDQVTFYNMLHRMTRKGRRIIAFKNPIAAEILSQSLVHDDLAPRRDFVAVYYALEAAAWPKYYALLDRICKVDVADLGSIVDQHSARTRLKELFDVDAISASTFHILLTQPRLQPKIQLKPEHESITFSEWYEFAVHQPLMSAVIYEKFPFEVVPELLGGFLRPSYRDEKLLEHGVGAGHKHPLSYSTKTEAFGSIVERVRAYLDCTADILEQNASKERDIVPASLHRLLDRAYLREGHTFESASGGRKSQMLAAAVIYNHFCKHEDVLQTCVTLGSILYQDRTAWSAAFQQMIKGLAASFEGNDKLRTHISQARSLPALSNRESPMSRRKRRLYGFS